MAYNKLKSHPGIFYIAIIEQVETHDKLLIYDMILDAIDEIPYDYDFIEHRIEQKYDDYKCYTCQLTYIPIHYYTNYDKNDILYIVSQICLNNKLEHVRDNSYRANDDNMYILTLQEVLKVFGLNDIKTLSQIMKYIKANKYNYNSYAQYAKDHINNDIYALSLINLLQKYIIHTPSYVIPGFNPYSTIMK